MAIPVTATTYPGRQDGPPYVGQDLIATPVLFSVSSHAVVFIIFPVPVMPETSTGCAEAGVYWFCIMFSTDLLMSSPANRDCSFAVFKTETPRKDCELEMPVISISDPKLR